MKEEENNIKQHSYNSNRTSLKLTLLDNWLIDGMIDRLIDFNWFIKYSELFWTSNESSFRQTNNCNKLILNRYDGLNNKNAKILWLMITEAME